MPRPVSHQTDVQRRVIEILHVIAPNAPFPTRFIADVIAADSLTGGSFHRVLDNLFAARSITTTVVAGRNISDEITHDVARGTIMITTIGKLLLHQHLKRLPLTPQARQRQKLGLDNVISELIVLIYQYAAFLPGVTPSDALSPDHLALVVPHLLHFLRSTHTRSDPDGGPAQELATLWLLNNHGVVPEHVLAEYTHLLIADFAPPYDDWDWHDALMLRQIVEEMLDAAWNETTTIGGRLLDIAEVITPNIDAADLRARHRMEVRKLRQKLARFSGA